MSKDKDNIFDKRCKKQKIIVIFVDYLSDESQWKWKTKYGKT